MKKRLSIFVAMLFAAILLTSSLARTSESVGCLGDVGAISSVDQHVIDNASPAENDSNKGGAHQHGLCHGHALGLPAYSPDLIHVVIEADHGAGTTAAITALSVADPTLRPPQA